MGSARGGVGREVEGGTVRFVATYGRDGNPRTLGSNHGTAFATTFNGWDEEKSKAWKGVFGSSVSW